MRVVLCVCAVWALASSAAAQASPFAPISPLDAAVFADRSRDEAYPVYEPTRSSDGIVFAPVAESYAPNLLERFQEVRRYGGRLSIPVTVFGADLLLEGEGARDYGPSAKKLDIGRLRLTKELGDGLSAGFEIGAYRSHPTDLPFKYEHADRDYTFGIHVTKSR